MTSLFNLLLAAFEPLKNDYLARVKAQADLESREIIEKWKNDFLRILKNSAQFAEKFRIKNDKLIAETTDKDYIKRLKHEKNYWNKEYANCAKRENEGIEKAAKRKTFLIESAKNHFDDSIKKLAIKIDAKGLIYEKSTFKTKYLDENAQNIECELTDGSKTVKCWTIVAWGEIQRPHYRFLVK